MLKNYFAVAIRNLMRHKMNSLINITGLAIGMASCALIVMYVQYELSYDDSHHKRDRIYRVLRETRGDDGSVTVHPGISGPLGPALVKDFPEVEEAVRVSGLGDVWTEYGGQIYHHVDHGFWTGDPNFLHVFDFPLVKGDRNTALDEPFSLVITEETALRYFGNEDPIGKVIAVDDHVRPGNHIVTGVIEIPENSSLRFDMITSSTRPSPHDWSRNSWERWRITSVRPVRAFIVLKEGQSARALEAKLPAFMERYMGKEVRQRNTYRLQPLNRVHLHTGVDYVGDWGWESATVDYGDIHTIQLFSAVGGLILLIACVNFMNLSTARSASRAKEVGMRKVLGAFRIQLIQQFLGEAILLSLVAFLLALGLVILALPEFSAFAGKDLLSAGSMYHWLYIPGLVVFVGLLAGSYPAFFLSAFAPASVLKGSLNAGVKGAALRKGLVVFQFTMSVLLIIGTVMVYRQLTYVQNKKLGFNRENLIRMPIYRSDQARMTLVRRHEAVKDEFLVHPSVLTATSHRLPMGEIGGTPRTVILENGEIYEVLVQEADEDFLDTFGIEVIEGRTFPKGTYEGNEIILNEAALKQFGWEREHAIGKEVHRLHSHLGPVIGVVTDFHSQSLHLKIRPLIIFNRTRVSQFLTVRVHSGNLPETIAFLEKTWKELLPERPFQYDFVDEKLNQLYREEVKLAQLMATFSLLAVFVACSGLFGLAAYTVEQRTKEIGVRKVLGASVCNLSLLLSWEFVKLVLWSNLIAWPVAYVTIQGWLENFAYRVDMVWWVFGSSAVLALFAAFMAVGYQAVSAALTNPVDALRHE